MTLYYGRGRTWNAKVGGWMTEESKKLAHITHTTTSISCICGDNNKTLMGDSPFQSICMTCEMRESYQSGNGIDENQSGAQC